ncbi:MAG: hypothetical protein IJF72_02590 [Clostridia bacterium]|nr:hypothetical protein [Clostridia bacterium]
MSQKLATKKQLLEQLDKVLSSKWDKQRKLSLLSVEKALNKVCLTAPKTERQQRLFQQFDNFAYLFERVLSVVKNKPLLPADKKSTRLERLCQTIAQMTAFCLSAEQYRQIKLYCANGLLLKKEVELFDTVYALAKCQYYAQSYFDNSHIGKLVEGLTFSQTQKRSCYAKCNYLFDNLVYGVDCLGESAVYCNGEHVVSLSQKVFYKKKNVLDSFDASCFGKRTALFSGENDNLSYSVQRVFQNGDYFNCNAQAHKDGEYQFVLDLSLPKHGVVSHFVLQQSHCFCIQKKSKTTYVAVSLLQDEMEAKANVLQQKCPLDARICHSTTLSKGQKHAFSWAVVYADTVGELAEKLRETTRYGATKLWQGFDSLTQIQEFNYIPLSNYNCSNLKEIALYDSTRKFDCRLGEGNLALLVDSKKGVAPLLNGFVFGTSGINLLFVDNFGNVTNCICDAEEKENAVCYRQGCVDVKISCKKQIVVQATSSKQGKLLFFVKFENLSKVTKEGNVFHIQDKDRNYSLMVQGKICSFTTNLLECNLNKMRLKMSDNLSLGQGLCLCLSKDATILLDDCKQQSFATSNPLLKESVLSTCLNYLNDKNAFELHHKLKKPSALTLSAIAYTNQQFVYDYVKSNFTQSYVKDFKSFYYNKEGQLVHLQDRLLLPLGAIYYTMLTGDKSLFSNEFDSFCKSVFFFNEEVGQNVAIKALALKKYAETFSKDKVRILSLYARLKEQIQKDENLFEFAQAIGAVEMEQPSKEKLRALFVKHNAKGSFYYVSQLENLYGFSLVCDKLSFVPQGKEQKLESLSLNYKGKKFATQFAKGDNNKMVLNGITYFQSVDATQVKKVNNSLTIQY